MRTLEAWLKKLTLGLSLRSGLRALLCMITCVPAPGQTADTRLPEGRIAHGPFEIEAGVRRVSTGAFPNQGGNPFARREVSEYRVRFKGQLVATGQGNSSYWRVLRLPAAPRPALLLVTQGFVLASEDTAGQLKLQPITAQSSSLAELQWLDELQGQPGPVHTFGIEAVADLQGGTVFKGGRWLRLGSRSVLDVSTLTGYQVEPWVPHVPGVPITSISRDGDRVRAFSPGGSRYVLAAAGENYSNPDAGPIWGLLVVDIARGVASEIPFDRRRFRVAELADIDTVWINHHFVWQRDAAGQEQLKPRERFSPWPWRAKLKDPIPNQLQLEIPRVTPAAIDLLKSMLAQRSDSALVDRRPASGAALLFTVDGCRLRASVYGSGKFHYDPSWVMVAAHTEGVNPIRPPSCNDALRNLARMIDAEFATGRHESLLTL